MACMKAPSMARPAPVTMAGVPVASGATASTRSAKASSASGLLMSVAGSTWTRARPSGLSQSRRSSGGRSAKVTGPGTARRCRRSARTGGMPEASAPSSSRRLAGSAPRFWAKASSEAAKRPAALAISDPALGGRGDGGARLAKLAEDALDERRVVERRLAVRRAAGRGRRRLSVSAMIARLASWSFGTKDSAVRVSNTPSTPFSRAASARAASRFGASTFSA